MRSAAPGRRRRWPLVILAIVLILVLAGAALARSGEYTIELGPFDLPANAGHDAIEQPAPLAVALPVGGWVRGFHFEMVDAAGRPMPSGILHHLNLIAPEHRELFSQIMLRIGAAGSETKPYDLPPFLGYRVHRGDSLLVTAMLHNPTPTAYMGARLRVRLTMSPESTWIPPLGIQPVYLDVMPPAGIHAYDLPAGHSTKSWEGSPAIPVRLLAAGGHLHQYGISLRLEDATTGKVLWDARPKSGKGAEVLSMPIRYFLPFGLRLVPDHVYRLVAEYDNPTGRMLPDGGMGALGGVVMPASGTTWPTVSRSDSVYQHDIHVTMGGHAGGHRHGGMGHDAMPSMQHDAMGHEPMPHMGGEGRR